MVHRIMKTAKTVICELLSCLILIVCTKFEVPKNFLKRDSSLTDNSSIKVKWR